MQKSNIEGPQSVQKTPVLKCKHFKTNSSRTQWLQDISTRTRTYEYISSIFTLLYSLHPTMPMLHTTAATEAELASSADHRGGTSRQLHCTVPSRHKVEIALSPGQRRRHQHAFMEDHTQYSSRVTDRVPSQRRLPQPPGSKDKMQVKI